MRLHTTYLFIFLPFVAFVAGYTLIYQFSRQHPARVPSIIGLSIAQAMAVLSNAQLAGQLIDVKQDAQLPPGTVVHQSPIAGRTIGRTSPISFVATVQPPAQQAPACQGMSPEQLLALSIKNEFALTTILVPHARASGECMGQYPSRGQSLNTGLLVWYTQQKQNIIIMPDVRNHTYKEVAEFLQSCGMTAHITNTFTPRDEHIVIEQHPLAGTLIIRNNQQQLVVQLLVN